MRKFIFVLVLLIFTVDTAIAQEADRKINKGLPDSLFSPELITNSKDEIGLTPEQLTRIEAISDQLKKETQALGEQIKLESDELLKLLSSPKIGESKATVFAYRIFDMERQLRIYEITYLIRLKNLLTENQQKQLSEIRNSQTTKTFAQ